MKCCTREGISVFLFLRGRADAVPRAIVAGNRNIALFLIALPEETTRGLLIFIGCYQVPMYLTPLLMPGFYRRMLRAAAA